MIAELAHFFLILAFVLAGTGLVWRKNSIRLTQIFDGMCGSILISLGLMLYLFLSHDFSVKIIFEHVQSQLPFYYRLGALWGGHEGSMLLWISLLSLWSIFYRLQNLPSEYKRVSLSILLLIHFALLGFILFVSNPFMRLLPLSPLEGQDLNPLLQDLGMMAHPPLLYLGYVGFAIPYAMAMASLITQEKSAQIFQTLKKFSLIAWAFLSLGITLGSFWAYYELGWGGFWFWDPVENASVIPWFLATAWVHGLLLHKSSEENVLLMVWTFIATLLGTFLVRSGLLSSVHSFASDPTRGFFILGIVVGFALFSHSIYFKYAKPLGEGRSYPLSSRESFLRLNQILSILAASIIFLGTAYPLIIEALGLGFISVGPHYFNALLIPLGASMLILMGMSALSIFQKNLVLKPMLLISLLAVILGLIVFQAFSLPAKIAGILFFNLALYALVDLYRKKMRYRACMMHLAHLGFAIMALGIAVSQTMGFENTWILKPGETQVLPEASLSLMGIKTVQGPNFEGSEALLALREQEGAEYLLRPQKLFYTFRSIVVTETAILGNLCRDWYIALGEPIAQDAWSFRVQYKPMIRLIWAGGIIMALGMIGSAIRPSSFKKESGYSKAGDFLRRLLNRGKTE